MRSPLTLFLLFGIALFAADRMINGVGNDRMINGVGNDSIAATREIRITSSQQQALREAFQAEHGRQPSTAELRAKLAFWIDEQVLYREAMALNLDKADVVVRRQMAQKMRFLLEQGSALKPPSDKDLQAWLTQHASDYGTPSSIDFEHVFLSRGRHGHALLADAAQVMQQIKSHPEIWATASDPFSSGLTITNATPTFVRAEFGQEFATAVASIQPGQWTGPVASSLGLHFVRVTARSAFQPAPLAAVRLRVQADYEAAERKRLSSEALKRLKASYQIHFDDSAS